PRASLRPSANCVPLSASLPGCTLRQQRPPGRSFLWSLPPESGARQSGSTPTRCHDGLSAGQIGGTVAADAKTGLYTFTVTVTDPFAQLTTSRKFSIDVTPPAKEPPADTPAAITTASLPPATQAVTYDEQLQVTGGIAPYTWSVTSGTLPPGLSLKSSSGEISGAERAVDGVFVFTVQVKDADGKTASAQLEIEVPCDTDYCVVLNS
ncbi:MAG: Ig domain-containing protein, partial [Acidimicrobiales bacterium]